MDAKFSYGFWIWTTKLDSVLSMFSKLIDYEFWEGEKELIKSELRNTNDEKEIWSENFLEGKEYNLELNFAFDDNDRDIIHIRLSTDSKLKEKIEALDLFQSIFRELKE